MIQLLIFLCTSFTFNLLAGRPSSLRFGRSIRALVYGAGACALVLYMLLGTEVRIGMPLLMAGLCACAVSDLESGYIFDSVTGPLLLTELALATLSGTWLYSIEGAGLCAALIGVLFALTRGRGIGLGDLKLAACIGSAVGPSFGASALGNAFILGGAYAGIDLLRGRSGRGHAYKFAPFLLLGCCTGQLIGSIPWR